jgi:hypothetical protein
VAFAQKFYFAWVDQDQNVFGHEMLVMDENILAFKMLHEEGQIPTLEITILNPRVGFLDPHRKIWAWFSRDLPNGCGAEPLFFGLLVGIPSGLNDELIKLKFLARSPTYLTDKQAVAETMRVRPYWDPVFLDIRSRDDPDAILEGWSSLWHVDRVTLQTTASDILEGEDGIVVFEENQALYKNFNYTVGESPLTSVQVQMRTKWTQRGLFTGIQMPSTSVSSITGGTIAGSWLKPGQSMGGGWACDYSYVAQPIWIDAIRTVSSSYNYQNLNTKKQDCDIQSWSTNMSFPVPNPPGYVFSAEAAQAAICNPRKPLPSLINVPRVVQPPILVPGVVKIVGTIIPIWSLTCYATLRAQAQRDFSETAVISIFANTQPVLNMPTVQQDTKVITLDGADVGEPLIIVDAWSDFAGQEVTLGQIIFNNDPTQAGGLSYQICVGPGRAGTVAPVFSDIAGTLTYDGHVIWVSAGPAPLTSIPQWSAGTFFSLGEIVIWEPLELNTDACQYEPSGAALYLMAVAPGTSPGTPTCVTCDGPVLVAGQGRPPVKVCATLDPGVILGPSPYGDFHGPFPPPQNEGLMWWVLSPTPAMLGIPIGGTPTQVLANNYFPSDRGLWSIEFGIATARALMRKRARTVTVVFDCPIDYVTGLSCRMSATIFDPRLPGGNATGKIISYSMEADDTGKLMGHVEIGVAVGYGGHVSPEPGMECYALDGYAQSGYQQFFGVSYSPTEGQDITYTPPSAYPPYDDGRVPVRGFPGTVNIGTIGGGIPPYTLTIPAILLGAGATMLDYEEAAIADNIEAIQAYIAENATTISIYLPNVQNGPFFGAYGISTSELQIDMGINLAAPPLA